MQQVPVCLVWIPFQNACSGHCVVLQFCCVSFFFVVQSTHPTKEKKNQKRNIKRETNKKWIQ